MIGLLSGTVVAYEEGGLILETQGIGWFVQCSPATAATFGLGEYARLFIQTLVRQDAIVLVGFRSEGEKRLFNILHSVPGVGTKVAVSLIGTLGAEGVTRALLVGDKTAIQTADGVGPKLAQRLIHELKDKVGGYELSPSSPNTPFSPADGRRNDVIGALESLGFGRSQAAEALEKSLLHAPEASIQDLIRLCLKEITGG